MSQSDNIIGTLDYEDGIEPEKMYLTFYRDYSTKHFTLPRNAEMGGNDNHIAYTWKDERGAHELHIYPNSGLIAKAFERVLDER